MLLCGGKFVKKVLNKLIMSACVCLSLMSMLMIIDTILGVSISFYIYLILFLILESMLLFVVANVKKVLKIFIMSAGLSSSLIFTLVIINVIMKISIDFNFYLLLLSILTIGFTVGLTLFNSKKIFMKKKVKKSSNNNKTRKVKNVDYRINVRKKIS